MTVLKWVFLLLAMLVLALFVLRPVLQAATRRADDASADGQIGRYAPELLTDAAGQQAVADKPGMPEPEPDDPVARLRNLIEARGEESAQVLRHWMEERKESQ